MRKRESFHNHLIKTALVIAVSLIGYFFVMGVAKHWINKEVQKNIVSTKEMTAKARQGKR